MTLHWPGNKSRDAAIQELKEELELLRAKNTTQSERFQTLSSKLDDLERINKALTSMSNAIHSCIARQVSASPVEGVSLLKTRIQAIKNIVDAGDSEQAFSQAHSLTVEFKAALDPLTSLYSTLEAMEQEMKLPAQIVSRLEQEISEIERSLFTDSKEQTGREAYIRTKLKNIPANLISPQLQGRLQGLETQSNMLSSLIPSLRNSVKQLYFDLPYSDANEPQEHARPYSLVIKKLQDHFKGLLEAIHIKSTEKLSYELDQLGQQLAQLDRYLFSIDKFAVAFHGRNTRPYETQQQQIELLKEQSSKLAETKSEIAREVYRISQLQKNQKAPLILAIQTEKHEISSIFKSFDSILTRYYSKNVHRFLTRDSVPKLSLDSMHGGDSASVQWSEFNTKIEEFLHALQLRADAFHTAIDNYQEYLRQHNLPQEDLSKYQTFYISYYQNENIRNYLDGTIKAINEANQQYLKDRTKGATLRLSELTNYWYEANRMLNNLGMPLDSEHLDN